MIAPIRKPLFDLGNVTTTPAAQRVIDESGEDRDDFLDRHLNGDWGTILADGRQRNDQAVITGEQIVSEYRTGSGAKIRIVTDPVDVSGARPGTTIMLPSEMAKSVDLELDSSFSDIPGLSLDGFEVA